MSFATVSELTTYPIKSTQGISLSHAEVDETGLELDRHFVITDLMGKFITGRTKAKLVLVTSAKTDTGLILNAPSMPSFNIDYALLSKNYNSVTVWNDTINGQYGYKMLDDWFSAYLASPCRVYYLGEKSQRLVKNHDNKLSFADGFPFLLLSTASLASLNGRLPSPVTMAQFRANIVVDGCLPFAEDEWHKIQIGEVKFELVKPCSRCIFTTVNNQTGERDLSREPINTLKSFRQAKDREVYFGQNMIALNKGVINVGDKVEVISTQTPLTFHGN